MDPIGKIVAGRLRVKAAGEHPDADVLSAFAESALPDGERAQVLAHLAECGDCRQIVFFALPDSVEAQKVLSFKGRPSTRFALRWGTLAAVVAVGAVLFIGTRHQGTNLVSRYKQEAPAKAPGQIAAELKTPNDIAEMHALRDDRATTKTNTVRQEETDKVYPTPKHMTATPAGKFDFDQTGQVRMAPRSETAERDKLPAQGRSVDALSKLAAVPAVPAPSAVPQAVGGRIQNQNQIQSYSASGQGQSAAAQLSQQKGNLSGAVFDPSGAVIRNATVTMNSPVGSQTALSDATGQFSFQQVASGSYAIKAQAPGFKTTEVQQVAVLDNKDSNLRLTLEPGTVSEAVEVSAEAPVQGSSSTNEPANAQLEVTPAVESTNAKVAQNSRRASQLANKKAATDSAGLVTTTGLPASIPQWTLSADGAVQRSVDSGRTWLTVAVGKGRFRSLCAVGPHVWAGGKAGVLYHSADSGQSWVRVVPVVAGRKLESDITQVNFSDPINGEVDTINSEVWITSDGGQSWRLK